MRCSPLRRATILSSNKNWVCIHSERNSSLTLMFQSHARSCRVDQQQSSEPSEHVLGPFFSSLSLSLSLSAPFLSLTLLHRYPFFRHCRRCCSCIIEIKSGAAAAAAAREAVFQSMQMTSGKNVTILGARASERAVRLMQCIQSEYM